ncbi:10018_t:CDS:1, partial [Dentiscutata erythropus]
ANKVSPYPKHLQIEEFFSNIKIQELKQKCIKIINKESKFNSSALALLEVLQLKAFNLKQFSKEKQALGIKGICSLLHIKTDIVDIYDKDTQYIGECLDIL